jgi:2-dehydro-3-deoxyphosphogluconate aldolase/(4S)-4-hydroxy-2-oxoglutarate aldolase
VLTARDLEAARQAGARFAVSPGVSPKLLDAADDSDVAAAARRSHGQRGDDLLERGYRFLKFFPAVPAGGTQVARRLGQPAAADPLLSHRWHQPRPSAGAGISLSALPNVLCVGGSWLTPGASMPGKACRQSVDRETVGGESG